jgi:hypothetical protein
MEINNIISLELRYRKGSRNQCNKISIEPDMSTHPKYIAIHLLSDTIAIFFPCGNSKICKVIFFFT